MRGAFQNTHLGYWIAEHAQNQGIMTQAVGVLVEIARDGLGLHRIEAATLPHNVASQRVLEKNGFESYGLARSYLQIAGTWQDHRIYQGGSSERKRQGGPTGEASPAFEDAAGSIRRWSGGTTAKEPSGDDDREGRPAYSSTYYL